MGNIGVLGALAVPPEGRLLDGASVSDDKTIRPWDPASGRELARFDIDANVKALAVLPDGRFAAGRGLGRIHWLAIKGE